MRRILAPVRPGAIALGLLAAAAAAVLVVGLQHARLFHRGYAEVAVVGPLFVMNALGSLVMVLALLARRVWVFVLGALAICVPSLASIAASHSSIGFLGFREGGYDADALVIVVAEVAVVVFAIAGAAGAARSRSAGDGAAGGALRAVAAGVVVLAMGCAIIGIGMGSAPAENAPAPSAAAVDAARARIAAGDASVRRGRELFSGEGCDRCHAIAAIAADGRLGPRLDTLDEDLDDNLESIADPRDEIADGYPEKLMPADFARRLDPSALRALAQLVTVASGGERANGDDGDGSGRGRGRGRGGNSGEG